ncbi:hypothetical protein GCM10009128_06110 [Psychrosphaera haliotis]|uniref:phage major capsid protein n=1 Tax=Psychrosphaera haliotis TaxID=555083 RepID=UPI0031D19F3D
MEIKTYPHYQAVVAQIQSIGQPASNDGFVYLTDDQRKERDLLINAIESVDLAALKAKHHANKILTKSAKSREQGHAMDVSQTITAAIQGAIKSATLEQQEVHVKALTSSDAAFAIDSYVQSGIVERARKAPGLLGEISIEVLPSMDFKPDLVEISPTVAAKWSESGLADNFKYSVVDTSHFAQAIPSDTGFMGTYNASDEVVRDPKTKIVDMANESLNKSISESLSAELISGDGDLGEAAGVFTELLDSDNGYAEAYKPLTTRKPFIFAAMKSGKNSALGSDSVTVLSNLKDLIFMLPANYRNQSPVFVMKDSTWKAIQKLRTADSIVNIEPDSIDGYKVVTDENVENNTIGFGVPDLALGVGVYNTNDVVNPFAIDGAVRYTRKARFKSWPKANDAFVALLPEA